MTEVEREIEELQSREIEAGIADMDAGRFVGHDEVVAWLKSWGTEDEKEPPTGWPSPDEVRRAD